jgi:YHS domain-containing protein
LEYADERRKRGMVKDPVCNMQCSENTRHTSTYKGQKYYFCAEGCKIAFDKNPEKYLKNEGVEPKKS